ncbi:hypothetical protein ACFPIJ_62410 [Dactylosporangium cerinum]|uniref:Uncharacterized protein n=1 Tax=Dactylosporangium cerinum TaxID=1434730 RepID=A0ABV9WIL9_9ACTN
MPPVRIPAAAANHLTLPVCVRHGRPARMKPMVFLSRPPLWMFLLLLVGGGLLYLIVIHYLRKVVYVRGWPWCGRCGLTQLWRALLGLVILAAGAVLALGTSESARGAAALVVIAVTGTLMISGWVVFTRSSAGASAGVRVSRDGAWLELPRPHEHFVAALRAQPAPAYPMPAGWTVPAAAAPHVAVWAPGPVPTPDRVSGPAPGFSPVPTPADVRASGGPPVPTANNESTAPSVDTAAHGWAPPSA